MEDAIIQQFTRVFGEESVVYLMGGESKEVAVRKMQLASELARELARQNVSEPVISTWFTRESPRLDGQKPLEFLAEKSVQEARAELWELVRAGIDYDKM
ncbi:MAG: hypothetical protein HYS89_00810 [Candidatus Colwellbacteria bacterium]|nr:hypothetical protein [Candidatus Colwellbacteria bacterium]